MRKMLSSNADSCETLHVREKRTFGDYEQKKDTPPEIIDPQWFLPSFNHFYRNDHSSEESSKRGYLEHFLVFSINTTQ